MSKQELAMKQYITMQSSAILALLFESIQSKLCTTAEYRAHNTNP